MHRRPFLVLAASNFSGLASFASIASAGQSGQTKRAEPHEVPVDLQLDEASAVKIAEAIFVKVYGERVLSERPWKTALEQDDSVYHIRGTLKTTKGGVPEIRLKRSNAEVISICHGK